MWLVIVCTVPAVAGTLCLLVQSYWQERANLTTARVGEARALMQAVDGELAGAASVLQVLGRSPLIASGDFPAFQDVAAHAVTATSGNVIVLSKLQPDGQQVINTVRPFGTELPRHGNPELQRRVVEAGKPVISDVFVGAVIGRPLVAVEAPVIVNGQVKYTLAIGFLSETLGKMLVRQNLPSDWVAAIYDRNGTIAARTGGADQFVGKEGAVEMVRYVAEFSEGELETATLEGTPVIATFSRSPSSGWAVVIAVPTAIATRGLKRSLWLSAVVALVVLTLGTESARRISRRIALSADENMALRATIVESSGDAIISITLDGSITSWNAAGERIFGYSASEAMGRNISLIVPEDLRDDEKHFIEELRHGRSIAHLETKRLHKSGRKVDVSISLSPIRDGTGKIMGAAKVAHDITQRKHADETFKLVVERAPYAMLISDEQGRIVVANGRAETLLGYTHAQLLGLTVEALVPERYRSTHPGHRADYYDTPKSVDREARVMATGRDLSVLRKDGSECAVEIDLIPIKSENKLLTVTVIVDITQRKLLNDRNREFSEMLERQVAERTAQLTAANNELDSFAYAASHDLKAPLRVIANASLWLEQDLDEHLNEDTRESMALMRSRVKRMERLLDDLLDYSRIGREPGEFDNRLIPGDELMTDILALLSSPPSFSICVSPNFTNISLHRMPLQQILLNLISNAIKHHDRTSGNIEVTVEETQDGYSFSVEDDGPGISEEFHEQIFGMFRTLKPRDKIEGSGMGLALVRKHIDLHGGTLALESTAGNGSRFTFTWPGRGQNNARPQ